MRTDPSVRFPYGRPAGFTLIELMIVVVVVAILATIAYPSYQAYTVRSRRADAQAALMQVANQQERFFTQCNWYAATPTGTKACGANSSSGVLGLSTADSPNGYYTISIAGGTIDASACSNLNCGYTLIATPKATGPQKADGKLRMDSAGRKEWDKDNNDSWCCKWFDR